jgi:hypothetical protein
MLLNPCIISNVYKPHHHVTSIIKDIITEKINNNINFINNFFGKEYKYMNDTNRYYSSNFYNDFKNAIKFTKSYKDEMLNNLFIKYFYTDKDIDTFYNEYPTTLKL